MTKTKKCAVCGKEFKQKQKGRLRITKKKEKGESVAWICKDCADSVRIGDRDGR